MDVSESQKISTVKDGAALIDLKYLHDFFDGNAAIIEKMQEAFLETYTSEEQSPLQLLSSGSEQDLKIWLHTMKSSARYIGAVSLSELCESQERLVDLDDGVVSHDVMVEISQQLSAVVQHLRS